MNDLAFRLSMAYSDCESVMAGYADRCEKIVVYEHSSDEEVSRTHIHGVMVKSTVGIEGLKKYLKTHLDVGGLTGNQLWSWKHCDDVNKYVTYMSKGSLAYKFMKGFSPDEVEALRLSWVEKPQAAPAEKEKRYDELAHILEDWGPVDAKRVTFDDVRSWVFAWYWRRDGRIPHATAYKRMAGTLYLRIAEVHPQMVFSIAMEEVKNHWY